MLGLDAAPLLESGDAGAIAVTGSHAALFRGRPDNVINVDLFAAFFNDAGGGLDKAGIRRLADLEGRGIIAATVSAESAEIGSARSSYDDGVISHSQPIGACRRHRARHAPATCRGPHSRQPLGALSDIDTPRLDHSEEFMPPLKTSPPSS